MGNDDMTKDEYKEAYRKETQARGISSEKIESAIQFAEESSKKGYPFIIPPLPSTYP